MAHVNYGQIYAADRMNDLYRKIVADFERGPQDFMAADHFIQGISQCRNIKIPCQPGHQGHVIAGGPWFKLGHEPYTLLSKGKGHLLPAVDADNGRRWSGLNLLHLAHEFFDRRM